MEGSSSGGGDETPATPAVAAAPVSPYTPERAPEVGLDADISLDFDPIEDAEKEEIQQATGLSFDIHLLRARIHLRDVKTRAEELQAEVIEAAEELAEELDGVLAVHEGKIEGGVESAKGPLATAYSNGRGAVEEARGEAQGAVAEHRERAHGELETTHSTQFAALTAAINSAWTQLAALESSFTGPFTQLEEEFTGKYEKAAEGAAEQLENEKPEVQNHYRADDPGSDIELAKADAIMRQAGKEVDSAAATIREEGPARASHDIESLGHAEIVEGFMAPLKTRARSLGTEGFSALSRGVEAGRQTIEQGAASASKRIDADARRAKRQLDADEKDANSELDAAGEKLELDIETEVESSKARFTETAAAHSAAYDARVEQASVGLQQTSFLDEKQVGEYAEDQVDALDGMASRHRTELEGLDETTRGALQEQTVEGIESLEETGRKSAEQGQRVAQQKAAALRRIAARYGQGLTNVSAGLARTMSAYTEPFGPRLKTYTEEVEEKLEAKRDESEKKLKDNLERYKEELDAALAPSAFVTQIEPEHAADGFEQQFKDIAKGAFSATRGMSTSKSELFAALRQIESPIMGLAVREMYSLLHPDNTPLKEKLEGIWRSGVEETALTYLRGDRAEGARLELEDANGFFFDDEERIEDVLRSLDDETREEMLDLDDWKETEKGLRSTLSGTDLDVTEALLLGNEARADAYRLRDDIDKARRWGDIDELHEVLDGIDEGRREQVAQEFAHIQSGGAADAEDIERIDQDEAFDTLAGYATRELHDEQTRDRAKTGAKIAGGAALINPATAPMAMVGGAAYHFGDGSGRIDSWAELDGTDRDLADALIRHGSHSDEAAVTRVEHERTREGGPNQENLEKALMMSEAERHALRDDEQELRRSPSERAADLEALYEETYGGELDAAVEDMFADSSDSELEIELNQELLASGTNSPEAVAIATQLAIDGLGTDEDQLTRMWSGLTPEEADEAKRIWETRFGDGESLEDRFFDGVAWSLGAELSGDDAREQERLMMGDERYMNDAQRHALAAHEYAWSAGDNQGLATGASMALFGRSQATNLEQHWEELNELLDEVAKEHNSETAFDSDGYFLDEDRYDEYRRLCDFVGISAAQYRDRTDAIAGVAVNTIAVVGAVAAIVLTAGAATPLVAAKTAAITAGVTGAASMGTNQALRGKRYGWEEAAVDVGATGVSALTAGAGKYFAPSKASLLRKALVSTGTGAVGSGAQTALQDETWDNGFESGLGLIFYNSLQGGAASGLSTLASEALEEADWAKNWHDDRFWREVGVKVLADRTGNVVGESTRLGFDAATGQYDGSWRDALAHVATDTGKGVGQAFLEAVADVWAAKRKERREAEQNEGQQEGVGELEVADEDLDALASEQSEVKERVDELLAADDQASETLAESDAEQAAALEDVDDQIRETLSEGPDGEIRASASGDDVQASLDDIEQQILQVDQQVVDEIMDALDSIIETGDQVRDQARAELEQKQEIVAAEVAAAASSPGEGGARGGERDAASEGARLLGLRSDDEAIVLDFSDDQVREWQSRVDAGEGDQATVARRVAAGEPAPAEVAEDVEIEAASSRSQN